MAPPPRSKVNTKTIRRFTRRRLPRKLIVTSHYRVHFFARGRWRRRARSPWARNPEVKSLLQARKPMAPARLCATYIEPEAAVGCLRRNRRRTAVNYQNRTFRSVLHPFHSALHKYDFLQHVNSINYKTSLHIAACFLAAGEQRVLSFESQVGGQL